MFISTARLLLYYYIMLCRQHQSNKNGKYTKAIFA